MKRPIIGYFVEAATRLLTPRKIGGVDFDGTANINLPGVNTAGNQSTSGNAASATKLATARKIGGVDFDGTANISLPGVNSAGNQPTSGNAASATKLATARTIGGVQFDGTANINLPGVNTAGNQSTSGNAGSATKLATAVQVKLAGDVTSPTVNFDGSGALTLTATLANVGTAKSSGSAKKIPVVTIDAKGRVTGMTEVDVTGGGSFDVVNADVSIGAGLSVDYNLTTLLGVDITKYDLTKMLVTAMVLDADTSSPTNGFYINSEAVFIVGVSADRKLVRIHNSRTIAVSARVRVSVGMN